jgi:hypothetical protein
VAGQKLDRQPSLFVFAAFMLEVSASPLLVQELTKNYSFTSTAVYTSRPHLQYAALQPHACMSQTITTSALA